MKQIITFLMLLIGVYAMPAYATSQQCGDVENLQFNPGQGTNGDYMDATPTCFHTVYTEWNGNGSYSMHMNWGWGGTNNGYFSETWEIMDGTEKVNYSKDRKAIINLN